MVLYLAMVFKVGTEGPKVGQEDILHTLLPPRTMTVHTRQDRCMPSCWCQILGMEYSNEFRDYTIAVWL